MATTLPKPQVKHDHIVKVARSLFVKNGVHHVSIPMIVKASGTSTGAIYHHFGSKENLVSFIRKQTLDDFYQEFDHRLADKKTAQEKLAVFAQLIFEITENDPDMMGYMLFINQGDLKSVEPPLCFTDPFRRVQAIVRKGIDDGEIKPGEVYILGAAYTGVILRAAELRLICVLEQPLTQIGDLIIENAWAAIRNFPKDGEVTPAKGVFPKQNDLDNRRLST